MFFETNRKYFLATPRHGLAALGQPEAAALQHLFSLEGEAKFDDRRCAVEVQLRQSVPLRDNLLAVILPTNFLEAQSMRETLVKEWRTYPLAYPTYRGASPRECYGVIRDRLERYLSDGGYL
jgi:hypothetical protein